MTILATQSDSVRAASGTWQEQMKWAIRDLGTLEQRLDLPKSAKTGSASTAQFPVFVPLPFLVKMRRGDLDDPLLRQVLPLPEEDESPAHFSLDPLGESESTLKPGLLQKYSGRVLMVATGACAVHCRYCFRRHFPYQDSPSSVSQWPDAIARIAADSTIEEVILSGGDPLTMVDDQLARLIELLEQIPHLKRLRIHTRLPVMIPQRINDRLVEILAGTSLHAIMVIHANHANELDDAVAASINRLLDAGVTMLNQSVLLRGINDNADTLIQLSQKLLACRVMPYYLHQLDPVVGTSHFEVPKTRGIELIAQMRAALPGYAVPRYVKELAGEPNKTVWA